MSYLEILQPYLSVIKTDKQTLDQEAFQEALQKLEPYIEQLLRGNMGDVLNLLYRLDISEEKVKYILFGNHQEPTSKLLAEAILQREIVRRIFRLKYAT